MSADNIFKLCFTGLLIVLLALTRGVWDENKRLRGDIEGLGVALNNTMDTTRNKYGQIRAQVRSILLSNDEATRLLRADIEKLKNDFGFRVSGLKTYIEASSKYKIPVIIQGKDTVIERATERVYYMNEGSYTGTLWTKNDTLLGTISLSDTIRIVVSKGRRDSWWKIWKKRPLVTNAFLSNKDGSITGLKSVISE
jgi:hypothetical protein